MDQVKKKSSRDAARQRRGQQNDEYGELALQLPLPLSVVERLDRLCVMRVANSFIKIKHILYEIEGERKKSALKDSYFNSLIQDALGGFVFVLAEDGQCLYVSPNVADSLGLQQLDLTGHSIYKYVHPCDQENLARQLGGHVPLADMEIFDGLFSSESPPNMKTPVKAAKAEFDGSSHRSFFLRMKSTLTSRGKSVNLNASIHRVVQCTGNIQMCRMKRGISNGCISRCFLGIGTPLLSNGTFEVPIDCKTFITKHSLDMSIIDIEKIGSNILGYQGKSLINSSWYLYCHVCDINVLKTCHDVVLQQGQAVSGYYRLMAQQGGWIWVQTKANIVYSASDLKPSYIICTQYTISNLELEGHLLSSEQLDGLMAFDSSKKRLYKENSDGPVSPNISPPNIKPKTEASSPVYEYNFQQPNENKKLEQPKLNGFNPFQFEENKSVAKGSDILMRSPCIPFPFQDSEIKLDSLDADEDCVRDKCMDGGGKSLSVPFPSIDKILSFDDITFSDLVDCYQDIDFGGASTCDSPKCFPDFCEDLYEFNNAKVPSYLLLKKSETDDVHKLAVCSSEPGSALVNVE